MGQLDEGNEADSLQPISLGLPIMKELGAKWLEEMFHYICDNPQMVTSGFLSSGITYALDGRDQEVEDSLSSSTSDFSDSDEFEDTESSGAED